MPSLTPVPNTPLRDDPQQDSIWKRWLSQLRNDVATGTTTNFNRTTLTSGQQMLVDSGYEIIYSQDFTNDGNITNNGRITII
jgi:hypothetical protein